MECIEDDVLIAGAMVLILAVSYYSCRRSNRRWWVHPYNALREEQGAFKNTFQYFKAHDHDEFFSYTRMYPEQFDKLLTLVKPKLLKRSRRAALSPEMRLAMMLKYLAHGGSFVNLCFEFRVGNATVSNTICQTCDAIWETLRSEYIKTPEEQDWTRISGEFWTVWNFPNTLGAIDGKHVTVQCPSGSGSLYYNYKKYFSIVLLACCDANYRFTWVDIDAYGSENDAGIFRRSQIKQDMSTISANLNEKELPGTQNKVPNYFVGDEAFPFEATQYLLRPYPGTVTPIHSGNNN